VDERQLAGPSKRHAVQMDRGSRPDVARQRQLREEVGRFRARESRRVFDPAVHVGRLGEARSSFVVPARDLPVMDAGLRIDVCSALLDGAEEGWDTAWLTRPGTPEPHDLDLHWLAAIDEAFAMHGRVLGSFWVITRYGWRDTVSDECRVWKRLRL
jgi:hypothetical protein